jgi:hypothetical protein
VLGIALVGGAALLASGGGDDAGSEPPPATETAAAGEPSETLAKRGAGLALAHPSGWKRGERRGIVNLESPDRCVAISLSAPVSVSRGKRFAHLTQVVFRAPPCEATAEQTRAIVSSIEFSR